MPLGNSNLVSIRMGRECGDVYIMLFYMQQQKNNTSSGSSLYENGPLARNVKYFNDMQIAHDVTTGSLPNVWRPLEKALIISLHWFTEPFILFVRMQ